MRFFSKHSESRTELLITFTSLIGSGSEILGQIFRFSPDWNYFESSTYDPIFAVTGKFHHKDGWENLNNVSKIAQGWQETLTEHPKLLYNQQPSENFYQPPKNARLSVFNANIGTWNYKYKFLDENLPCDSVFIHLVRDPRSWINTILNHNKIEANERFRKFKKN